MALVACRCGWHLCCMHCVLVGCVVRGGVHMCDAMCTSEQYTYCCGWPQYSHHKQHTWCGRLPYLEVVHHMLARRLPGFMLVSFLWGLGPFWVQGRCVIWLSVCAILWIGLCVLSSG